MMSRSKYYCPQCKDYTVESVVVKHKESGICKVFVGCKCGWGITLDIYEMFTMFQANASIDNLQEVKDHNITEEIRLHINQDNMARAV